MIEVKNLHFQYEETNGEALKGINFTASSGEFIAVIGSNGSGKSTFAKQLNGLLLPTSGEVLVDGLNTKTPEEFWNIRQLVGMVFQNPDNQLIATTVEEDCAFGPENLGLDPGLIRERVDEALFSCGMKDLALREVYNLSGGQKQRVAIAGVMAMKPKYLVLDEPTAMLDPKGREEVFQAVLRLNKEEGITVIYITHMMEEAAQADRVVVMNQGEISLEGTTSEVFSKVKELKEWGLDIPRASELGYRLKEAGLDMPSHILTREELVEALCRLK